VTIGQVVARLAPAPLDERAREQAEATLQATRATRSEAEARLDQANIALDEARRRHARTERMAQAGVISAQEMETATAELRIRERDLDAARSRVRAAVQEERAARTALVGSDPSKPISQAPVVLRSPIAGRVLRVFEEHDRVIPAGTRLFEIGNPASIHVMVDVLSSAAVDIRTGAQARIGIPQGRTIEAVVTRVEPAAFIKLSPLGVEERRVHVELAFREPVTGLGDQFEVDVSIVLWKADSVLQVPATSLVPVHEGWGVYVVKGGSARLRPIQTGHRGAREVEILEGLDAGERVVRFPNEQISDGVRVRATPGAPGSR
jgi:HlyD family secretion protein